MTKSKKIALGAVAVCMAASLCAFSATGCSESSSFSTDKSITVVAREDGSGTKSAFMELVGYESDISSVVIQSGTAAVKNEIKNNTYAIAYDSLGYCLDGSVKVLKVGGVEPSATTIADGSYTISRPLQIVYKTSTLDSELYKAFYDYMLSTEGQQIVGDNGYVSAVSSTTAYTVNSSLSGTITISGSTSFQPLMTTLAEAYKKVQPNVTVTVSGGGSGQGVSDAKSSVSNFGMISRNLKDGEKEDGFTSTAVALDGIAIIVNNNNPLEDITVDQLKSIYDSSATDKITVWSQLIK